jgi:hypothetical protein
MGLINTALSGYKKEDLICGTWTVRTLFKTGALISALPFKKYWRKPITRLEGVV